MLLVGKTRIRGREWLLRELTGQSTAGPAPSCDGKLRFQGKVPVGRLSFWNSMNLELFVSRLTNVEKIGLVTVLELLLCMEGPARAKGLKNLAAHSLPTQPLT